MPKKSLTNIKNSSYAINPMSTIKEAVVESVVGTVREVANVGKKYFEEKTKVETVRTIEVNKTSRAIIEAKRDNRDAEIKSTEKTVGTAMTNQKEVSEKIIDYSKEISYKAIESTDNIANKVTDTFIQTNKEMASISEKHNRSLLQKNEEIEGHQKLLQIVSGKMIELRIREEVRNEYRQGIKEYVIMQTNYEEKLANVKNEISRVNKRIDPIQKELQEIELHLKIEEHGFDELDIDFEKCVSEIENLKTEYKDAMIEEKYLEHLKRSEKKLQKIVDDIDHSTSCYLNREKERKNKLNEIIPILDELEELNIRANLLENEKKKLEQIGLHHIGNTASNNKISHISNAKNEDIINVLVEPTKTLK